MVKALHSHQRVDYRRAEAGNVNRGAAESTGIFNGPQFGKSVVGHRTARRSEVFTSWWKFNVDSQAQILALSGDLPKHVVSFRVGLAQLEVGGAHLMRRCVGGGGEEHEENKERAFHSHLMAAMFFTSCGGGSMVTV